MKGNFKDGKNSTATILETTILIVGLIVMPIIQVRFDLGFGFTLVGVPVMIALMLAVDSVFSKGKFSADEKSVSFSVGFSKYEYSYRNIINIKTEIVFTEGRGSSKYPHIELAISLRNGRIARFSDTVPSSESDTLESLREYQKNHQFTKLADYIKLKKEEV